MTERRKARRLLTTGTGPTNGDAGKLREGGIEGGAQDPLRRHPMREPYAARSGGGPEAEDTPETVTRRGSGTRRRTDRADRSAGRRRGRR